MQSCGRCGRENPDDGRFCSYCGLSLASVEPALVRRTATLVFVDVVGSTALGERLDPEALTSVLRQYFSIARRVVESHGGTIMKFIGDAVVAVFGLPRSYEDDPVRAIRATLELLAEVGELNGELGTSHGISLELRAGINTGEVAADTNALDESFVFGDTANVAARLEQHAPTGGVLLGESTYLASRSAVIVGEEVLIEAKGKSELLRAFPLISTSTVGETKRPLSASPLVGRADQFAVLSRSFDAAGSSGVRTVTIIGEPGMGKTRLVSEFVQSLRPPSRAVVGRCLPYGEGITYWPVREMIVDVANATSSTPLGVLRVAVEASGSGGDPAVEVERIGAALGLVDGAGSAEDVAWGTETFLRHLAREAPVVVVFDDIHWAGGALLRLIERLAASLSDLPVLIVCAARPELLDEQPGWEQRTNGSIIHLEPLDGALSSALIQDLLSGPQLDPNLMERVRASAGGNPLFLEQTVRMLLDEHLVEQVGATLVATPGALDAVPTTLRSLLSARIDQLPPAESDLLGRAAVVGAAFAIEELVAITPQSSAEELRALAERLTARGLIDHRPGGDADSYAFRHVLVRDAAYERLTKADRSEVHEQIAAELVLTEADGDTALDELIGHHLERAYLDRADLRSVTAADRSMAAAAADRLVRAGQQAGRRGDVDASAGLLRRALDLSDAVPSRPRLLVDLGTALLEGGRLDQAIASFDEAAADPSLDPDTAVLLDVCRDLARLQAESAGSWTRSAHLRARAALELFSGTGDDAAVLQAGWLVVLTSMVLGEASAGRVAIDQLRSVSHGVSNPFVGRIPGMLAMNLAWGPTPAAEALATTSQLLERVAGDPSAEPLVLSHHAQLLAITDHIDDARAAMARMRTLLERKGQRLLLWGAWSQGVGRIELDGGDPGRAEAAIREGYDALVQLGERGFASTLAGQLAHVLIREGRPDEADLYVEACRRDAGEADVLSQLLWLTARAELDREQQPERAAALVDEATALVDTTEWPTIQGQVLLVAASVHAVGASTPDVATGLLARARASFTAKGNLVGLRQAAALEAQLASPHAAGASPNPVN